MPFVRISLNRGREIEDLRSISDTVHLCLVEAFAIPEKDKFHAIHQHDPGELVFDADYLGPQRTDGFILLQITGGKERTVEQKKALYALLASRLESLCGFRADDVMVIVSTNDLPDWSFGAGHAQMLEQ